MKQLHLLLIVILLACTLHSCRRTADITCDDPKVMVYGVGFKVADYTGGVFYRYKQDGAFDSLIDSAVLTSSTPLQQADTMYFPGVILGKGADYKIVLPAINRTYNITAIAQSGQTHKTFTYTQFPLAETFFHCVDDAVSCNVNGAATPIMHITLADNNYQPADMLYIQK